MLIATKYLGDVANYVAICVTYVSMIWVASYYVSKTNT
jgi:hypothetical protein